MWFGQDWAPTAVVLLLQLVFMHLLVHSNDPTLFVTGLIKAERDQGSCETQEFVPDIRIIYAQTALQYLAYTLSVFVCVCVFF